MGNPAWGHGYHQGFDDGFSEGKKGGLIVAGATIVVSLVVTGATIGYREFRARSFAKREQALSAEESNSVTGEGTGDEHKAGEGVTSE